MERAHVREFYDQFFESTMLQYRLQGNLRLEKAARRILPLVEQDAAVLDVGCGIGIITEKIARAARRGKVWGVDLSPQNIQYARQTISEPNLEFFDADVLNQFDEVRARLDRRLDLVTLVDVIEHLPETDRAQLFRNLRSVMNDRASCVLTYPNPAYLRSIHQNDPDLLQVIDNPVELHQLAEEVRDAGLIVRYYSLEEVWRQDEYVHCVLQTYSSFDRPQSTIQTLLAQAYRKVKRVALRPYRKRKYVTGVFGKQ